MADSWPHYRDEEFREIFKKYSLPESVLKGQGFTWSFSKSQDEVLKKVMEKHAELIQKKTEEMMREREVNNWRVGFRHYFRNLLIQVSRDQPIVPVNCMDRLEWRDRMIYLLHEVIHEQGRLRAQLYLYGPASRQTIQRLAEIIMEWEERACPVCDYHYTDGDCGARAYQITSLQDGGEIRSLLHLSENCPKCKLYRMDYKSNTGVKIETVGFAEIVSPWEAYNNPGPNDIVVKRCRARDEFIKGAKTMYQDERCKPFLAAIRENTDDWAPKLVFADFLEENCLYVIQAKAVRESHAKTVKNKEATSENEETR